MYYGIGLLEEVIRIYSIFKLTLWRARNILLMGRDVSTELFGSLYRSYMKKYQRISYYKNY